MKKIFVPILLGFALVAASCQNNLDIPQKGVVSYDTFYASDEDAEAAITSMYGTFVSEVAGTEGIDNPEQVILNYSADDILAAGGYDEDHAPFRYFCEFNYDGANTTLKQAYQRYYTAIYKANLVISNFTDENRNGDAPKHTSAFTNQCVAEARVMRAYLHMMTALMWNCPPLMDRVYDADELPTNAESQSQILEWVIAECEKAISSGALPKRNGTGDKNATARMSVGFAQFVAGKAAMFNNDPATARKYLGALIASGNYALVPSDEYWINFHAAGDGSVEKIFEPNFLDDPVNSGFTSVFRSRWMVANVFCWRTDALASELKMIPNLAGWNGGAITEAFAQKFLAHDGDSPRRKACFLTENEWLYELDWTWTKMADEDRIKEYGAARDHAPATLEEMKNDECRGIKSANGVYSHGPYFEWKHMCFGSVPSFLTGGKEYMADNAPGVGFGAAANQKNFNVARYAEALLLYAEACIGSGEEAAGLKALQAVQERSGSGKVSDKLTFEDVMEEKQYEMWFENCRFLDLVRWSKTGRISNLPAYFNGDLHKKIPTVKDEFFIKDTPGYHKEHKLFTTYSVAKYNDFVAGKHEYLPFPNDVLNANPNLHNVLGWASAE